MKQRVSAVVGIISLSLTLTSCSSHSSKSAHEEGYKMKAYYVMNDGNKNLICDDVGSYTSSSGELKIACESDDWERTYYNVPIVFEKGN